MSHATENQKMLPKRNSVLPPEVIQEIERSCQLMSVTKFRDKQKNGPKHQQFKTGVVITPPPDGNTEYCLARKAATS